MWNAVEAAILSTESTNGLFNSLAGSGNVLSEGGSALPFSSILQSQQLSTAKNLTLNTPTGNSAEVASPLLSGAQSFPSLQQLSMASPERAAAAPWLTLQAQAGTEQVGLSTDELQTLEAPATLSWVDPALSTVEPSAPVVKESLGLVSNLAIDAKQGNALTSVVGGNADESMLFESSGGGGQSGQTFQPGGVMPAAGGSESPYPHAETIAPVQAGITPLVEGEEPAITIPVQTQPVAGSVRAEASAVGDSGFEATKSVASSLNESATVVVPEKQSGGTEPLIRSEGMPVDKVVTTEGEAEPSLSTAQFRSAASDRTTMSEPDSTITTKGADSAVDSPAEEQDTATLRTASGAVAEPKPSETKVVSDSRVGVDLPEARGAATVSDKQRSAEVTAAQVASTNSSNAQGQSNAAAVSATDAMSTQVRSAMQPQAKKGDPTERVDTQVATDGREGYHWLDSGAEAPVAPDSELLQGNRSIDAASGGMAGVNTAPTNNTAVRNEATVEAFSSVKQAVDVAQTSEAKAAELSETANLEIETPVRDAQWSQAFAYRVQFMATQGIQRAQVQLNPAELGPMEITIDLVDDVAQVQIIAEQAATKEAVEQAVPRLREMMAQSGFGETNVELSSPQDESRGSAGDAQLMSNANNSTNDEGAGTSGGNEARTAEAKPIETLGANERPTRTADGRMSFYV